MTDSTRLPIRRRLLLLTVLGMVGGVLFVPFVLANPAAGVPAAPTVVAVFALGSASLTALSSWGGLLWADRAGLPMPLLRRWEVGVAAEGKEPRVGIVLGLGGILGLVAALVANVMGVPDNPGSLLVRVMTTPFAAVVPEALVHLLVMSGLVLALKRVWLAVLLSAFAFVVLFHGNPPDGAPAVMVFVVGLNFGLGTLTGWVYARWGFVSAMLTHAAAHFIVVGIN